jgi:hypothetical protein
VRTRGHQARRCLAGRSYARKVRWLRAAWRHGYALTAIVCGLGVFAFSVVETARGYSGGQGPGWDLVNGAIIALASGAATYGLLRLIGALYGAGILRGR